jgi:hypothetical protein
MFQAQLGQSIRGIGFKDTQTKAFKLVELLSYFLICNAFLALTPASIECGTAY